MPVTARLSQKFYERFGDDIAGEFVDWFNAVDLTYQQQLREQNDLNWERFKSEMDARFAQFRAEMDVRFAELKAEMDVRFAELKAEMDVRFAQMETRLTEKFTDKLSEMKGDLMKWMFIYWSGTLVSLGGLMVVLLRK